MQQAPQSRKLTSRFLALLRCGSALIIVSLAGSAVHAQGTTSTPAPPEGERPGAFRFAAVDEASLGLWEGNRPILVYNHGVRRKPGGPAAKPHSCYIHPLYGLDGEILTDDFPDDHLHHRGVFWAWPHVTVDGRQLDLWMQNGIEPRFERWGVRRVEETDALLGVENGWYATGRKVMSEQLLLRVHRAGDDGRAIYVELTWTPVEKPVTLGGAEGKSYGGLTVRFAPGRDTQITVPSGLTKDDLYMTSLAWADLTRQWPGYESASGAAVFVHSTPPDYPPTWLTRHYGVLCLGWPGVRPRTLAAGEPVRCRYRIWIHRGRPDAEHLGRAHAAYLAERVTQGTR
jgi:hypothetical protein